MTNVLGSPKTWNDKDVMEIAGFDMNIEKFHPHVAEAVDILRSYGHPDLQVWAVNQTDPDKFLVKWRPENYYTTLLSVKDVLTLRTLTINSN